MVDLAKVADLCLLLIDASYGFEMESFEFLNILQVHGFTKVLGVLTHLDCIKKQEQVKKLKKKLKHRFWTEVCEGAKLFYLTGLRSDLYTSRDTLNLSRFISVVKPRPLTWRSSHSSILVDRVEDITDPELITSHNGKIDRTVCLYGYVRGTFMRNGCQVHVPGAGDFHAGNISSMDDPLPFQTNLKRRTITDKHKGIY
ncbi:hypothetical protein AKO1_008107, partial [Acrasis kona]